MKKNLFKLVGTLVLLSLSAVAQQGLYRAFPPGVGIPQGVIGGESVWLCTATQTLAQCQAAPVAFTSDQAGASAITAPLAVGSGQPVQFYAVPGNYQLAVQFNGLPDAGTQLLPINVPPDSGTNVALNDGYFIVGPSSCFAAVSGTAGAGNNTVVIDGSVPALKASSTNAGASNATFTCNIQLPTRLTSGKGATIQDVTYLYSVQTTTATSMVASTLTSFTAPAPGTGETASSATLVAFGGTLAQTPVVGSANLTSVSAGQYYSEKVALGTPAVLANFQSLVFTFQINQTAAAAQIVTTPGLIVHYSIPAL